jgi:tetratricopeptide (TPR) repeat protein
VDGIGRTAEVARAVGKSPSPAVQTLDALVKDCPTDWLAQTDVQMTIGYAYGRLKQFDNARRYLITALAGEGDTSTTTMRAVEHLANYEARRAEEIADGQPERARELHASAIARLEQLLAVAETAERHNLLGSAYKRRAVAESSSRTAKKALSQASEHYRQAHLLRLQRQSLDPYPALNWLTLATLLDEHVPDADALIERCAATARERFSIDRKFFTAIDMANAAMVRAFRSDRLGQDGQAGDDEVVRLQTSFEEVVELAGPTASELDSVGKQIDIIGRLLKKIFPNRASTRATLARLSQLRGRIAGEDGSEGTGAAGSPGGDRVRPAKPTPVQRKPPKRKPGGEGISA